MKTIPLYIAMLLFMLQVPAMGDEPQPSPELLDEIESNTLRPFFNALKSGNVRQIERYISGIKLQEAQLPKNEDPEYQELLREHYRDAVFTVERAVSSDDQIVVDVRVEFPGRGEKLTQFYLQHQAQDMGMPGQAAATSVKRWSITDQRHNRDKER